jgi:hypothetical protein
MSVPKRGIYFLANDNVLDWLIASINSIRAYGCDMPIVIIPFDDRIEGVARFAERRNATIWFDDSQRELDELGAFLGFSKTNRHLYRKLAAFSGPLDEF